MLLPEGKEHTGNAARTTTGKEKEFMSENANTTQDIKVTDKMRSDIDTILTDKNGVKKRLFITAMNTEDNAEFLSRAPHIEKEDLSIVCRVLLSPEMLSQEGAAMASMVVTDKALERMGFTKEELFDEAFLNAPKLRPAHLLTRIENILGYPEMEENAGLYLVTTEDAVLGAAVIFYPGMMEAYSRMLKGGYYILPSSKHELLLLPDTEETDAATLIGIVKSINAEVVSADEKLSDSVYHYSPEEHEFEKAETYEKKTKNGDTAGTGK